MLLLLGVAAAAPPVVPPPPPDGKLRATLLTAGRATRSAIERARRDGCSALALRLSEADDPAALREAAGRARAAGMGLYYWIEVGRCPALADAHPEWMASLQGHREWRRLFPSAPEPGPGEVVKNYPWVPIASREAFDGHLARVRRLLAAVPKPRGLLLNDLQAAPSSCGCGNAQCRWTADYGPIHTTTPLGEDAAGRFVTAVRGLAAGVEVVPVWTTECEKDDGGKEARCAGVSCFEGTCWKAWTAQLMPVAKVAPRMGALTLLRTFAREEPVWGGKAAWVGHALRTFETMPPVRGGQPLGAGRIIAVLEAWSGGQETLRAQLRHVAEAEAGGYVIARIPIDQRWEPRVYPAAARTR
jgi:hypothetical protein